MRVLVVESDARFGGTLVAALARTDSRLLVVGWASDARGAMVLARASRPDVVLVGTIESTPLQAAVRAVRTSSPAALVALVDESVDLETARAEPVAGFLTRSPDPEEIARSFLEVAELARASSGERNR
jgi:AmiR/NasT family two-component response regulator